MTKKRGYVVLLCSAVGASSLAAGPAIAEEAVLAEQEGSSQEIEGIEEIIVTAQKRPERLTEVPTAVTALSGYTLEQHLMRNVESVQRMVPSLSFRKGTTTRNSALFLRGIGTISFSTAAEPSVSTVVDGVVYARSGQAFDDFLDLERVEVLRGPQGTLFGKNASAGVINITTRRPSDEVEAEILTSTFQGNEYRVRGIASGPITDDVAARIAAHYGQFDGHIRNVYNGDYVNGYRRGGARGTVVWTPTANLDLTLIGDYSQGDDDCCAEVIGAVPAIDRPGLGAAVGSTLGPHAKPNGVDTHTINQDLVSTTRDTTYGASLQADLYAGTHVLTSVSAFRGWDNTEIRDGDFMAGAASHVGMFELHDLGEQTFQQISQELRVASPEDQLIEYQAGLFLFVVDSDRTFTRDDVFCRGSGLPADDTGIAPCTAEESSFVAPSATARFGTRFENQAAFGQATLNATDAIQLTAGGRLTRDHVSFFHRRTDNAGVGPGPGIKPEMDGVFEGETTATGMSGKVALEYAPVSGINTYVSYARGYKGPAFNVFFNFTEMDSKPINPETSNAVEAGVKGALWQRRLYLSAVGFYQKFNNFQANNFVQLGGTMITTLTNAGQVSTRGVELELTARPTGSLNLASGLSYTDAHVDKFKPGPDGQESRTRPGEDLPLSPNWKVALTGEYRLPLESLPVALPFDVRLSSQFYWQSLQYSDFGELPQLRIPSYGLWDAAISFAGTNGRVEVTVAVRNILDQSFATLVLPGAQADSVRYLIPREASRYVGASLRVAL